MTTPGSPRRPSALRRDADEPTAADDREFVRRLLAGDETAFDEFASGHLEALYRFARRRLDGDTELTREIVQRTLSKVFAELATYRGEGPFFGWLCACCRNEIRMHFRTRAARPRRVGIEEDGVPPSALAAPEHGEPDRELLRTEVGEHVHQALDLLAEHYARALEWKYLEGISVAEIGRRLSLSPKAAESVLTRARAAFRQRYGELRAGTPRDGRTER